MTDNLYKELQPLVREGKSPDEILRVLYLKRISITDAIVAVRALYGIKLNEAKKIVASSDYWIDQHKRNQEVHEAFEELFDKREASQELAEKNQNRLNAINVIAPYKYHDMWVFDDPHVGLAQEPFVGGADTMIDRIVMDIPNAALGFVMLFSRTQFPGYSIKLEWQRVDGSGNWYHSQQLEMECWLCPALFKYFSETPKEIFVQVKPKMGQAPIA